MRRHAKRLFVFSFVFLCTQPGRAQSTSTGAVPSPSSKLLNHALPLHETRHSPSDLEVGGDLAGLPRGTTRYVTHDDLLALPQVSFLSEGDSNFSDGTPIGGVRLEDLAKQIAAAPSEDMAIAICDDKYRANYPRAYMSAHHPVLVLSVNGQPPSGWPKDSQEHKYDMGPYMISHAKFVASFRILADSDEPQIPWGVVRIEFRNEQVVYLPIAPRGPHAKDAAVRAGYRIARQNCFKCHNSEHEGGEKSGVFWRKLADLAAASPELFGAYIQNPASNNAQAQMPGNPSYDAATLRVLTAYFQSFHPRKKP